jgi:hypothetical protein
MVAAFFLIFAKGRWVCHSVVISDPLLGVIIQGH